MIKPVVEKDHYAVFSANGTGFQIFSEDLKCIYTVHPDKSDKFFCDPHNHVKIYNGNASTLYSHCVEIIKENLNKEKDKMSKTTYLAVFSYQKSGFRIHKQIDGTSVDIVCRFTCTIGNDTYIDNFISFRDETNLQDLIIKCKQTVKQTLEKEIFRIETEYKKLEEINNHIEIINKDLYEYENRNQFYYLCNNSIYELHVDNEGDGQEIKSCSPVFKFADELPNNGDVNYLKDQAFLQSKLPEMFLGNRENAIVHFHKILMTQTLEQHDEKLKQEAVLKETLRQINASYEHFSP